MTELILWTIQGIGLAIAFYGVWFLIDGIRDDLDEEDGW